MDNKPTINAVPPYEEGVYKWYDSIEGSYYRSDAVHGTSAQDSMEDTDVLFEVPSGYSAEVRVSLTVDDWGLLLVTNQLGEKVMKISLTQEDDEPGERGGHEEWSGADAAVLPAGRYVMSIHHENVTYPAGYDPKYNISSCSFSLTATKTKLPTTITATAKVILKCGSGILSMNRSVELLADVVGEGENTRITNLRIGKYDSSPAVQELSDGRLAQIILLNVSAVFTDQTHISTETHIATRTAKLTWKARIIDPLDPTGATDREVENSTGGNSGNPDATFRTSTN